MVSTNTDVFFDMADLYPKHTGLPFVVWISVKGGARHDARVKVSLDPKAQPGQLVSVTIRPEVRVVEGTMSQGSPHRVDRVEPRDAVGILGWRHRRR